MLLARPEEGVEEWYWIALFAAEESSSHSNPYKESHDYP